MGARAVVSVLALHGLVPPLELASTRELDTAAQARRLATRARRARVAPTLADLAAPAAAFPLLAHEVERLRRLPHVDAGRDPLWLALVETSERRETCWSPLWTVWRTFGAVAEQTRNMVSGFIALVEAIERKPTIRQVYALAAALCEHAGEEFPETSDGASALIERLRIENGHPAPRLEDSPLRPRRRGSRGRGNRGGGGSGHGADRLASMIAKKLAEELR